MRYLFPLTLLITAAAFVGCSQQSVVDTPSEEPETVVVSAINDNCPIMGDAVTDDGGRVDWNGKTVGFCCPGCIKKFEALSDEEKGEALAKADEGHEGGEHGEHDHGDHDHDEHEGETTEES